MRLFELVWYRSFYFQRTSIQEPPNIYMCVCVCVCTRARAHTHTHTHTHTCMYTQRIVLYIKFFCVSRTLKCLVELGRNFANFEIEINN